MRLKVVLAAALVLSFVSTSLALDVPRRLRFAFFASRLGESFVEYFFAPATELTLDEEATRSCGRCLVFFALSGEEYPLIENAVDLDEFDLRLELSGGVTALPEKQGAHQLVFRHLPPLPVDATLSWKPSTRSPGYEWEPVFEPPSHGVPAKVSSGRARVDVTVSLVRGLLTATPRPK